MIQIHFSFWLAAGLFLALGRLGEFLLLFAALTAHELSHVAMAKFFGCPLRQLRLSALGEAALVPQMHQLPGWKRSCVIAAGPACNALLWGASWVLEGFFEAPLLASFGLFNGVLFFFNLLPIFPLDGARLAQLWVGNRVGVVRANRGLCRIGRLLCVGLILLGIVQAALFFPNFSLLFVGMFLLRRHKDLASELNAEFYLAMLDKPSRFPGGIRRARLLCADANQPLARIVERMGWDGILLVAVPEWGHQLVGEPEIMRHVMESGMAGTVGDLKPTVYRNSSFTRH